MNKKHLITSYTESNDFAAICASHNIRKASRMITNLFEEHLRPLGLRMTQLTLLMALDQAGAITITQLSEVLAMDRTTLARDLKPLEKIELVSIIAGEDRRKRIVTLTPKGVQALAAALPLWKKAQTQVVTFMGVERYQNFLDNIASISKLRN